MASSTSQVFLAMILVLSPAAVFGFDWDNIAPSIAEDMCKEVECGKGTCKWNGALPLGFTCQCEAGWKRTRDQDDEDDYPFLPCVVPNCTLNYGGCQPAPPPVPEKEDPRNISAFDPCYWAYCGEGTCTKSRTHTHMCQCKQGFSNLLNISAFPCFSECTLGSDCSRLGIRVADSTAGGGSSSNDNNQATSFLPGTFQMMMVFMVSMGMAMWK